MSVAMSHTTSERKTRQTLRRTTKSWTTMSIEQKSALDGLAKANHMSTAEFIRVVLLFAIEQKVRLVPQIATHKAQ